MQLDRLCKHILIISETCSALNPWGSSGDILNSSASLLSSASVDALRPAGGTLQERSHFIYFLKYSLVHVDQYRQRNTYVRATQSGPDLFLLSGQTLLPRAQLLVLYALIAALGLTTYRLHGDKCHRALENTPTPLQTRPGLKHDMLNTTYYIRTGYVHDDAPSCPAPNTHHSRRANFPRKIHLCT